jgi:hypothetical protein
VEDEYLTDEQRAAIESALTIDEPDIGEAKLGRRAAVCYVLFDGPKLPVGLIAEILEVAPVGIRWSIDEVSDRLGKSAEYDRYVQDATERLAAVFMQRERVVVACPIPVIAPRIITHAAAVMSANVALAPAAAPAPRHRVAPTRPERPAIAASAHHRRTRR